MNLEELQVYQLSIEFGEKIQNIVAKWNYFEKDTVGKQLVKSADSIAEILVRDSVDIFIKRTDSFVITQEVHSLKQEPGLQMLTTEI